MICPHCAAPNADDARFCGGCGRATSATEPVSHHGAEVPSLVGREIAGRYRILSKLGEGGMGTVYKAEQTSLKRAVAIKLLRPEVASSQLLLRRFNAEAEAVAKLSHPNTVNIYDFGQDSDGTLFIAMEYIEGTSLRHVIHKEAPLPLRRTLQIAQQIAASLTDAHATSIVHRDLKPDNVMIQERGRQKDIVRVLDFGIAKLRDENRQSQLAMTQAGDMLGTPQYMAPEQIRAEHIDGRTDVYALGCMMYEMITGRLPFEAPTVMSLLSKHLLEVVVAPSQRRPDLALPLAIDQLVLSAMAKDPAARPPTMEEMGERIAGLLATLPVDTQTSTAQVNVPASAGYPTPHAYSAAPYHPAPPPSVAPYNHPPPPQARGSNVLLWVVVLVLAIGGTGVGVYFGVVRKSAVATPADAASEVDDPWANTAPTQPTPTTPVVPGRTATVEGIAIDLPPGFVVEKSNAKDFMAVDPRGVAIGVVALPAGADDGDEVAREYAETENLTMKKLPTQSMVAGQLRDVFVFTGEVEGVLSVQIGVPLVGPSYRAALLYHAPAQLANTDPSVGTGADAFFATGVHTP